jgi:Family of unknown function (DUF5522)
MAKEPLQEGVHFSYNEQGLMVLTAHYLRERGYCCGNRCQNCPYTPAEFEAARQRKRNARTWFLDDA